MKLAPLALLLVSLGCSAPTEIVVDVHTDLVPGEEVDRLVMSLEDRSSRSYRIDRGMPFLEVARRFGPIATSPGVHSLTVSLERSGTVVLSRTITGRFSGTVVLTAWLTRACVGVVCPTASDPEATECDDGTCVRPDCAESPGGCVAPTCSFDLDCTDAHPACATNACTSGRCVLVADDSRCAASEYCDPDVGCVARSTPDAGVADGGGGTDAPLPDAPTPVDAGPPPPSYELRFLSDGAGAWATLPTTGPGPTEPVLAAFASTPYGEIVVFTASETFILRTSDRVWVDREPRTNEFAELEGEVIFESETVVEAGPRILYVYVSGAAYVYDWDGASRTATYQQSVARSEFPVAEWGTPLAAPYYDVVGVFGRPNDPGGWVTPETADRCSAAPIGATTTYISWDGFGPAAMLVSTYDYACFRFVDKTVYGSFPPFGLPGAPDPWSIEAAAWEGNGLYLFVAP